MFWYLLVFFFLTFLAYIENGQSNVNRAALISAIVLVLFGGLRYETGFDWQAYEGFFAFSPTIFGADQYVSVGRFDAEPGFVVLNSLFRSLGLGFQSLIFAICLFNIYILYIFINRFSTTTALILLWYFGMLFLVGQMSTIRQSLSVSFVYLAVISADNRRMAMTFACMVLAILFHTFSLIFLPIVFLRRNAPSFTIVAGLAAVGYMISLSGADLFRLFATTILPLLDGGLISSKITLYASYEGAAISFFASLLLCWHLFYMWVVQRSIESESVSRDYIINVSLWMTVFSIIAHTYLATFPAVWNRLMLVTFVVQAIVYSRIVLSGRTLIKSVASLVFVTAVISFSSLSFTLLGPQSLVFKPYQSMIVVWFRGPYGDGWFRSEIIRQENDQLFQDREI